MSRARYIVADVFEGLDSLEAGSVDLIMTSPPFLALRSYLPPDHPDKGKEIGSEQTPADFIDTLLDVVEACERVLAPHGSIVFELGDTYAGSGGAGGDYAEGGLRDGQERFDGSKSRAFGTGAAPRPPRSNRPKYREGTPRWDRDHGVRTTTDGASRPGISGDTGLRDRATDEGLGLIPGRPRGSRLQRDRMAGWPMDKSLCFIPQLFGASLAYGCNLLRPDRLVDRWRIRNVVAWCRPNPPVGALGDKVRPAVSYLTIATKARDRYFDLDAVRSPYSENTHPRVAQGTSARPNSGKTADNERRGGNFATLNVMDNDGAGAPPLDYWVIPTAPYKGAHYATYPPELCRIPILSMCPQRVCTECGEPSRRIVEVVHEANRNTNGPQSAERKHMDGGSAGYGVRADRVAETKGWTDCGHGAWRNGIVLDPFAGSGTTLEVATGTGRDAIGLEIDGRNAEQAIDRVGMFLTVETLFLPELAGAD